MERNSSSPVPPGESDTSLLVFFTYGCSLRDWFDQGIAHRELRLYRELAEDGYSVTLLTYGDERDLEFEDELDPLEVIPVYAHIKRPNNKVLRYLQTLLIPFLFKDEIHKHDLFKTNQMFGGWIALVASLIFSTPLLLRCGYEWFRNAYRSKHPSPKKYFYLACGFLMEYCCYHGCDKIFISNFSDQRFIREIYHVPNQKIEVVRNYIDTDTFKKITPHSKRADRLIYVGRLNPSKNLEELFKALKPLDISLDILGKGLEQNRLQDLANSLNVEVNFLGVIQNDQVPKLLNQYKFHVLPSLFEGNPKAIMEAMACELVVIGTKVPGIREIIQNGQNGFLSGTTSEDLRSTLDQVTSMDEDELEAIGEEARKWIQQRASFEHIFDVEKNTYKFLIKSNS